VNVITSLSAGTSKFVPDILVTSGSGGGAMDGLAATAMRFLAGNGGGRGNGGKPTEEKSEAPAVTDKSAGKSGKGG